MSGVSTTLPAPRWPSPDGDAGQLEEGAGLGGSAPPLAGLDRHGGLRQLDATSPAAVGSFEVHGPLAALRQRFELAAGDGAGTVCGRSSGSGGRRLGSWAG